MFEANGRKFSVSCVTGAWSAGACVRLSKVLKSVVREKKKTNLCTDF